MKKIVSLILFFSLFATNIALTMEKMPMLIGAPDATPYVYSFEGALARNPLFQKMKQMCTNLEKQYDIIVENILLSSEEQQRQFLSTIQEDPEFLEASEILSSVIFTSSTVEADETRPEPIEITPEQQDIIDLQFLVKSFKEEKIVDTTSEVATTASVLSWSIWYQQYRFGNAKALQYMLDNDLFDSHNSAHIAVLNEASKTINPLEYIHTIDTNAHKQHANSCQTFTTTQKASFVALLKKTEHILSELQGQFNLLYKDQEAQKGTLLALATKDYDKNNAQLQTITPLCSQNHRDSVPNALVTSEEFVSALQNMNALWSNVSSVASAMNAYKSTISAEIQQYAIENNK